jgi:hypothetical protein
MDAAIKQPEAFDLPVLLTDWYRLLDALDELWRLAGGWIGNAPDVPLIDRETAGLAVQAVIRAALGVPRELGTPAVTHSRPLSLRDVLVALEGISGRLGAIERHLGLGETGTDGT